MTSTSHTSQILLLGKPNCGKSLLFNKLTGMQQHVANFPGVTVEVRSGRVDNWTLMDFPGVYSLNPLTRDEQVAVAKLKETIQKPSMSGMICLLDATRLERSLLLGLQVQRAASRHQKPLLFGLTMVDELRRIKQDIDVAKFAEEIGSPVIPVSGKTGEGITQLKEAVAAMQQNPAGYIPTLYGEEDDKALHRRSQMLGRKYGPKADIILKNQNRLDEFFLSSWIGGLAFVLIMMFLFQAIFTWSSPLMDFVENGIGAMGAWVASAVPPGIMADFIKDAIFGGFGSFLTFVPQIFILTFIIGILEDTGYLARAAIICHRPLSLFGLSGKSFVPMLSGHACAIPAIFAARTIESPKRRLLTILAVPLMSCSARLPVYSLLITALIPPITFAGILGLQGLAFFALYAFGILTALVVTSLLAKTSFKNESDAPFIIELPPYRMPSWRPLVRRSLDTSTTFVTKAGGVIFTVAVTVWVLGYFPGGEGQLESSWLAQMGRWIEPVFTPIGLDWKFGVAVLASFVAREVFVGTLGTLFGIATAEEQSVDLAAKLQQSGLSMASGIALLAFYAIALQCGSTLAVMRRETGKSSIPMMAFIGYGLIGYVAAWILYQIFA